MRDKLPMEWQKLSPGATIHMVGVCGSGMKALAELLMAWGRPVSGSDLQPASPAIRSLCQSGLQFWRGHAACHVPPGTGVLVYSPAIRPENPERCEARLRGIPEWSYPEAVGHVMAERHGICIAGTHGKSTTTALVSWILESSGRDPSYLIGAEWNPDGRSARAGASPLFVVESCEFQSSFLHFRPTHAAILNIEPDHFDCFPDQQTLEQAFAAFSQRIPASGVLVFPGDSAACRRAVATAECRKITFGSHDSNDWVARDVTVTAEGSRFQVRSDGKTWGEFRLPLPGRHNVDNALAAAALCASLQLSADEVGRGMATFPGIRRRFERVGIRRGMPLILDYAHHPTAIRATLQGVRERFGGCRIWCAFQPHQISRTLALWDEFATAFELADEVLIVPVFAARETYTDEPRTVSRQLADRICANGQSARFVESLDLILPTVDDAAAPGDVLIAMGAGDIDRIQHEFT